MSKMEFLKLRLGVYGGLRDCSRRVWTVIKFTLHGGDCNRSEVLFTPSQDECLIKYLWVGGPLVNK